MGRRLRHRPGGVGLRSERSGITGAMGPSMSWDPWPRPAVRAAVGTQECTQIGKNGPSAPFWAICVHCCDARCDASCDARSGKVPCTASLCRPETFSIPDEWEASHGRQFEKLYSQTSLPDSLQSIDASVELAHRLLGPVLAGLAGGVTWSLHETAWEDQICYGKRRRIPRIRPRPAAGRPCNRPS